MVLLVKKKNHIVIQDYCRSLWLVLVVAVFLGCSHRCSDDRVNGNAGMSAPGLSVESAISLAVEAKKDRKMFQDGRELKLTVKDTFVDRLSLNNRQNEFAEIYGQQCSLPFMGDAKIC
jgi:hypothetical protein